MGLERFLVLIQPAIASLSYEYPSVGDEPACQRGRGRRRRGVSRRTLPAAMTGSLISSLVIGQRNSQGVPEEKESLLSSSTLLHSLFRRPTDSARERNTVTQMPRVGSCKSWKNGKCGYMGCCSALKITHLWSRPLLSTNSCSSRLLSPLSLHSARDGLFFFV